MINAGVMDTEMGRCLEFFLPGERLNCFLPLVRKGKFSIQIKANYRQVALGIHMDDYAELKDRDPKSMQKEKSYKQHKSHSSLHCR